MVFFHCRKFYLISGKNSETMRFQTDWKTTLTLVFLIFQNDMKLLFVFVRSGWNPRRRSLMALILFLGYMSPWTCFRVARALFVRRCMLNYTVKKPSPHPNLLLKEKELNKYVLSLFYKESEFPYGQHSNLLIYSCNHSETNNKCYAIQ